MGKATAADVFSKFDDCTQSLERKKMIQISSDGLNVNLSFLNLVRENRKDNNLQELLEIGTCGLHTVHCGFHTVHCGLNIVEKLVTGILINFCQQCTKYLISRHQEELTMRTILMVIETTLFAILFS